MFTTSIHIRKPLIGCTSLVGSFLFLAKAATALVAINDVHSGSLLIKDAQPGLFAEAPKVATDYTTSVAGPIARTIVTQQFYNPSDQWVEGVYVFPLPDHAAVDSLKIVEGTRVIIGDVKEKQQAKAIYEEAKASGKGASLLEQQRPNLFTNSVANIGPHEKVLIQIEYQEQLHQSGGTYSLRLPLVAAPRYEAKPQVTTVEFQAGGFASTTTAVPQPPVLNPATDGVSNPVSITVNLDAGFTLGDVKSETHQLDVKNKSDEAKVVSLTGAVPADRDFELTWKAKGVAPQAGLFKERVNNHDYLLAFVTPPETAPTTELPRDITFVIDNSGSMAGTSMPQAKQSLLYGLSQLKAGDQFNVIRFDNTMTNLFGGTVAATEDNLAKARNFVENIQAHGGTEMVAPMRAALADLTPDDKTHLRQVVFITDGEISNEQELFSTIAGAHGRTRVFMVGIGSAPNTYLMTHASQLGHGTYTQISEPKQLNARMTELFGKIGHPVITDLKVQVMGSSAKASTDQLPDLYRGEPVRVLLEGEALSGEILITGKIGNQPWQTKLPIAKAGAAIGVGKLWARDRINDLETAVTLRQMTSEQSNSKILALALEQHLVSSQTSLVAVEKSPRRPPGVALTRADVPLNLPAGWEWEKVFGTSPAIDTEAIYEKAQADTPSTSVAAMEQVALPQTATDGQLLAILGLVFGLFGISLHRRKVLA